MSKWEEVTIKCPNCGKVSKFKLWDSINTTLDPEMKQKVRDGSAFSFTCPHCGYQTYMISMQNGKLFFSHPALQASIIN